MAGGDEVNHKFAGVAGAILTSGVYGAGDKLSIWKGYYGEDTNVPHISSIEGLVQTDVPLLINDAELDPENFRIDAAALLTALKAAGRDVPYLRLKGHSHLSETYAVGTGDESLSAPVLSFIRSVSGAD